MCNQSVCVLSVSVRTCTMCHCTYNGYNWTPAGALHGNFSKESRSYLAFLDLTLKCLRFLLIYVNIRFFFACLYIDPNKFVEKKI